jgi:tetratricopeptide (TPR) repeat protein
MVPNNPGIKTTPRIIEIIGKYEQSLPEHENFYMDDRDLADIAKFYIHMKLLDKADEILQFGSNLHPDSYALNIQRATFYLASDNVDKAENILKNLNDPRDIQTALLKFRVLLHKEDIEGANRFLAKQNFLPKARAKAICIFCNVFFNYDYPAEALKWLHKILLECTEYPPEFFNLMSVCYVSLGQWDDCIATLKQVIDKDPYNLNCWILLAECYSYTNRDEEANEAADFAIAVDNESGKAHALKAKTLFNLKNDEGCLSEMQKAIELNDDDKFSDYTLLALSCKNLKRWEEGCKYSEKAKKSAGRYIKRIELVPIYQNEAICRARLHEYKTAHYLNRLIHNNNPYEKDSLIADACIYLEQGDYISAEKLFKQVLSTSRSAYMLNIIGDSYLNFMMFDKAITYYEKALAKTKRINNACFRLIVVAFLQEDVDMFKLYQEKCKEPYSLQEIIGEVEKIFKTYEDTGLTEMKPFIDRTRARIQNIGL